MHRIAGFFLFFFIVAGIGLPVSPAVDSSAGDSFYHNAPQPLLDKWLQFHEENLCTGMDAVFEFNEAGMKVKAIIEDEKSFQKFQELIQPVQNAFKIEVDAVRPAKEKKDEDSGDDEKTPPPSVWENDELIYNLTHTRNTDPDYSILKDDHVFRMRMYLFTVQILDLKKKMERYAADMRDLALLAADSSMESKIRMKAKAICIAHSEELKKVLSKLRSSLALAIPNANAINRADGSPAEKNPVASSIQIAEFAHGLSGRIEKFIYPEQYTVTLEELRESSLLDSLKSLFKMNMEFQKNMKRIK